MAHFDKTSRQALPCQILIVEDDALLRAVAVDYLEECGYPVLEAASADEALPLLRENGRIGVVFSDVQMPGSMNGFELAHWIARERADVKVVLTSGKVVPVEVQECPLLATPYRLAEVARTLHELAHSS